MKKVRKAKAGNYTSDHDSGAGNPRRDALGRLLFAVGTCCVLFALTFAVRQVCARAARTDRARETADRLEAVMPPVHTSGAAGDSTGVGTESAADQSSDDQLMTMMSLDGSSYVGVLSVPDADTRVPVCTSSDDAAAGAIGPYVLSGSPRGCLVLADPSADGYLADFWRLSEGEELTFTDVDGAVVTYRVKAHVNQGALNLDDQNLAGSRLILCSYNGFARRYQLVACVLAG